ncbi:MAG: acylphosphatase [Bacteroidales bacterium]|nr:acylphosphatase [Bacteroidales bacterium]
MKTERENIAIKIYGDLKEQGIRFSSMHEAYKTGVKGIAKYTPDGAVYIEAEGPPEQVKLFKAWCLKTAEKYDHEKTEIHSGKIKDYTDFNIID